MFDNSDNITIHSNETPLISVCWLLTSTCNYNCNFCFKVPDNKDLTYNVASEILDKLAKYGIFKISFSGGEPLLWSGDTIRLIKKAKDCGMTTMLITNGSLLTGTVIDHLRGYLDWITLPLDGSSEEKQVLAGRPGGHFTSVIKLLDTLNSDLFKLKINSVLGNKNKDDIGNIAKIIKSYNIKRWKVFQFFPIRYSALKNREENEISEKEFRKIEKNIRSFFTLGDCSVYFGSNEDLGESYFTIAPNGTVFVSNNSLDKTIGDLTKKEVSTVWNRNNSINKGSYWKRASWFYNL